MIAEKKLEKVSKAEIESYEREAREIAKNLGRVIAKRRYHVGAVYLGLTALVEDLEKQYPQLKEALA